MTAPTLITAANGHNWLVFDALNTPEWRVARDWLSREGFIESGAAIRGLDEAILPSLVRRGVALAAGFDNWSGYYLLAECNEGDQVLLQLANHVAAKDCRSVA